MGIWMKPRNKAERDLLKKKVKALKALQDEIGQLVGDDILWDHFGLAVDRLKVFTSSKCGYLDPNFKTLHEAIAKNIVNKA